MSDPNTALRHVAFVDAGYLRQLCAREHKAEATDIVLSGGQIVGNLSVLVRRWMGRFVRAYIYDGAFPDEHPRRPDQRKHHEWLAQSDRVRLRLGTIRERTAKKGGLQQKGVDTLLVLDMLQLAQLNAYDVALLLAGDSDFAEVVDAVQRVGREVLVLAAEDRHQLADQLVHAADIVQHLGPQTLARMGVPSALA